MYNNLLKEVVIVEDEPLVATMLTDFVKEKVPGIVVHTAATGEEGLRLVSGQTSLVILDYHLDSVTPGALNGLQVLQKLQERHPALPVVMHTSQDSPDVAANTIRYGAMDYVVKGANAFARLEMILHNVLKSRELRKNLGTQKMMNVVLLVLLGVFVIAAILSR